jgi:hypothetical protein
MTLIRMILLVLLTIDHDVFVNFADFFAMHAEIRDIDGHTQLKNDLIEHLWRIKGNIKATTS